MCYTVTRINDKMETCSNCGNKLSLSKVSDKEVVDYILKHVNLKHLSGIDDVSVCEKCKIVYIYPCKF